MEEARGTQRQGSSEVIGQVDGRDGVGDLLHMLMEDRKRQEERVAEENGDKKRSRGSTRKECPKRNGDKKRSRGSMKKE